MPMSFDRVEDAKIRSAVFEWLTVQVAIHGDVLPRALLAEGMLIDGRRVPMLGPQGIFKPQILDVPLSLTTSPNGPYDDGFESDGIQPKGDEALNHLIRLRRASFYSLGSKLSYLQTQI